MKMGMSVEGQSGFRFSRMKAQVFLFLIYRACQLKRVQRQLQSQLLAPVTLFVPMSMALLLLMVTGTGHAAWVDQTELHPPIALLDEAGDPVLDSGKPYSSKMTCGTGCHDYKTITHAFHIEQGREETSDDFGARRGLPQLVGPGYFGGYNCMGGNNPDRLAKKVNASADDFADLGSAGWVQRCAGCHSGGGWMELDRNGRRYDEVDPATVAEFDGDYYNRGTDENNQPTSKDVVSQWDWKKSGVVENDCLICHVDFKALKSFGDQPNTYSHGTLVENPEPLALFKSVRRNELIRGGGFFRYANSTILGYINLNLTADTALDQAVLNGFQRDLAADNILKLDAEGLPIPNWNPAAFDVNGEVTIPMLRFPDNDNCMMCHRTSNSRRGFYGFGEGAAAVFAEDGALEEDYQDDVHKGKIWAEAGSGDRAIENCNACHARNYYRESKVGMDMNASHDFLKGNSDMDVRNDLDYAPNAKSCEYCHNDAENPAIPSGQTDMLGAHLERWKNSSDMFGYPQDTLTRITQTHLDVVSCQACHITDKKGRRGPLIPSYRYRQAEDGTLKIVPYNPKARYFWRDKNSGRVLNKTERNSVFEVRGGDGGDMNMDGDMYGVIVDPVTGAELATVSVRMSHGSLRFGDPTDYAGFLALKSAYDKLFIQKGVTNPDAVLVWSEINAYLMSHNTRPAVSSVQCEDCHSRKQDGSFSSLVSADGLLGEGNSRVVTTLLDPRLFTEGLVVFDDPYMKVDAAGVVTQNVADVLYATKMDPSMTALRSANADVVAGVLTRMDASSSIAAAGISGTLAEQFTTAGGAHVFSPSYGDRDLRAVVLMTETNSDSDLVFPTYRMQVAFADTTASTAAAATGMGGLVSRVFSLEALKSNGDEVTYFSTRVLVKLPYEGSNANRAEVNVITSTDGGASWTAIDGADIAMLVPPSDAASGYVAFWTNHFSDYAVVDSTVRTASPDSGSTSSAESSGGGGGGAIGSVLLLSLLAGYGLQRRRKLALKR
jgi:hypothetical protein